MHYICCCFNCIVENFSCYYFFFSVKHTLGFKDLYWSLPNMEIFLCDFYRGQAWERWISATANGMPNAKETILVILRAIRDSECEKEYQKNLNYFLKRLDFYNKEENIKLRHCLSNIWLPCYKVSATLYFHCLIVHVNLS